MEKKKRPRIKRSPEKKPGRRNGAQGFDMKTGHYCDRDSGNKNAPNQKFPVGTDYDIERLQKQMDENPIRPIDE